MSEDKAGKYLTFILNNETYGLEILKVREIIGMMPITAIPKSPPSVKGVINLRGKVIPVTDLRLKFDLEEAKHTEETCIIVVYIGSTEIGIVVDKVSEVLDISGNDIEESPQTDDDNFVMGMGKVNNGVIILLDIEKILKE